MRFFKMLESTIEAGVGVASLPVAASLDLLDTQLQFKHLDERGKQIIRSTEKALDAIDE